MIIFAETLKNRKIMRLKTCMLMCSLFMASLASASNFASDSFKTKSGKELTITFIKHGSLMLTYDNHSIQVDPVSEYADYTTFPKADIILITTSMATIWTRKRYKLSRKVIRKSSPTRTAKRSWEKGRS